MKNILLIPFLLVLFAPCLQAQKNETITVKAGSKIQDCFSVQQRYRYPAFTAGKVYFQNRGYSISELNLNFLSGEMEFLHSGDTLSIANPKDIELITIATDTFYYDNGYLELLRGEQIKVAVKQYFKMKEIQKKDSYGNSGTLGATDAYSTYQSGGISYKLIYNRDMVFEKLSEFYLAVSNDRFVPSNNEKQILKLFPKKKDSIQDYFNSNKTNFGSKDDVLKLADFLITLSNGKPKY